MSLSRIEKFAIKKQTRGLYRTMLTSTIALRGKYPEKTYHSDYGKMALTLRPGWEQESDEIFRHRTDLIIRVDRDDSIVDIIYKVLEIELANGKLYDDPDYYLDVFKFAKD